MSTFVAALARAHLPPRHRRCRHCVVIGVGDLDGAVSLMLATAAIGLAYLIVFAISGVQSDEGRALWARLRPAVHRP